MSKSPFREGQIVQYNGEDIYDNGFLIAHQGSRHVVNVILIDGDIGISVSLDNCGGTLYVPPSAIELLNDIYINKTNKEVEH